MSGEPRAIVREDASGNWRVWCFPPTGCGHLTGGFPDWKTADARRRQHDDECPVRKRQRGYTGQLDTDELLDVAREHADKAFRARDAYYAACAERDEFVRIAVDQHGVAVDRIAGLCGTGRDAANRWLARGRQRHEEDADESASAQASEPAVDGGDPSVPDEAAGGEPSGGPDSAVGA
ncbi:hypothetical protein ER308_07310 [Egibacter rhizosphaerae]|uniref:Uncharacterized protein n=1 Tax=Egibacter rhizosphaerae TaxID=1670831 RepID=A0A411YDS2_9ACTN|nr:hypothetical protein [Egibacter rhizosphaerae]QBI19373.1 hypothetical protein ER308_07310 [Egibacter rhizosphaerae]